MDLYALRDITKYVINMTLYLCLWRGWSFGTYDIATENYLCLREMSLNWIKRKEDTTGVIITPVKKFMATIKKVPIDKYYHTMITKLNEKLRIVAQFWRKAQCQFFKHISKLQVSLSECWQDWTAQVVYRVRMA